MQVKVTQQEEKKTSWIRRCKRGTAEKPHGFYPFRWHDILSKSERSEYKSYRLSKYYKIRVKGDTRRMLLDAQRIRKSHDLKTQMQPTFTEICELLMTIACTVFSDELTVLKASNISMQPPLALIA